MRLRHRLLQAWNSALVRLRAQGNDAPALELSHPILGSLTGTTSELNGTFQLGPVSSKLVVRPDGQSTESAVALAATVVQQLAMLNEKFNHYATNKLLPVYNSSWCTGAKLSPARFSSMLRLSEVDTTGTELVTFWFECGDLFGGHVVSVTSFDGVAFNDLHAQLQG